MPVVEIHFSLEGDQIPVDHGYHLFSAISRLIPFAHKNEKIGVQPISGQLTGNRLLNITKSSCLKIRLPSEDILHFINLAGKTLNIGKHKIILGVPNAKPLIPSECLYSRLVIIKGFMEPIPFLEAVKRQLDSLEIDGTPTLIEQSHIAQINKNSKTGTHSPFLRRTIKIKNIEVLGFALKVEALAPDESIRLQENGIGGRRRFGCGIFNPCRRQLT